MCRDSFFYCYYKNKIVYTYEKYFAPIFHYRARANFYIRRKFIFMEFEYNEVRTTLATIEIDDIGNCCLLSRNELEEERYLVIQSILGETTVIYYGPIVPDIEQLPMKVSYTYSRFDFDERKLIKQINTFMSDATHVELCKLDYIRDKMKNMIELIEDFPDEYDRMIDELEQE